MSSEFARLHQPQLTFLHLTNQQIQRLQLEVQSPFLMHGSGRSQLFARNRIETEPRLEHLGGVSAQLWRGRGSWHR